MSLVEKFAKQRPADNGVYSDDSFTKVTCVCWIELISNGYRVLFRDQSLLIGVGGPLYLGGGWLLFNSALGRVI